jgi:excisionase family DNA binding protein
MSENGVNLSGKRIFTTGEAAKVCNVSQQTIIRCFDNGRITGFKVPGSKFRRIPREELIRFMRENAIPLSRLGERRRVLVVDDDPSVVQLLTAGLERDGRYEVRSAGNGFDAGLMVESFSPDLIVLDYMLPDIDGAAVCRRLRGRESSKGVRVLCVSATGDPRAVDELMKAGADGFLAKPFHLSVLLERLEMLLSAPV